MGDSEVRDFVPHLH